MKSPWDIIGRFVSGLKPAQQTSTPLTNDGMPSYGQQSEVERKLLPSYSPDGALQNNDVVQRGGSIEVEKKDNVPSTLMRAVEPVALAPAPAKSADPAYEARNSRPSAQSEKRRQTQRSRREPLFADPVLKTRGAGLPSRQPSDEQQATGFAVDVMAVEVDIRALRRELAQKLKQQNAQLREMLERFGRT